MENKKESIVCIGCKVEKDFKDFPICKVCNTGYSKRCKKCISEISANKRKVKAEKRIEHGLQTCVKCDILKPLESYEKSTYLNTGVQRVCNECKKQAKENYDEKHKIESRIYRKSFQGRINVILRTSRKAAKLRNIPFDLDSDWVKERLEVGICEVSGLKFDDTQVGHYHVHPFSVSIDKIDPLKGYTKDNCRLVCWIVNVAKQTWNDETVFKMCKAVVDYNNL